MIMSAPMTPDQWRDALRAEGLTPAFYSGWTTYNRNHKGPFSDVRGVMIHHTAGRNSLEIVHDGRPDLPGPLAHAHLSKTGTVTQLSTGRTNHAGDGSQAVYDAVVAERPLPAPGPDVVDGNARFYGLEIENLGDGHDSYPRAQYDAAVRYATAICRFHGWNERSVIGHKQWTKRKIDPSFSMNLFQSDVAERLSHPASWNPGDDTEVPPVTTPIPPHPIVPQAYAEVMMTDAVPAPRNRVGYEDNPYWTLESYMRDIAEGIRINREMLAELLSLAKR
jgi:hypothetical protein